MKPLIVTLGGRPVPTARVRVVNGYAATPRETVQYQALFARAAQQALKLRTDWDASGVFALDVAIYTTRKDCDGSNILKGIEDALVKAKVLKDDNLKHVTKVTWEVFAFSQFGKPWALGQEGVAVTVIPKGGRCS